MFPGSYPIAQEFHLQVHIHREILTCVHKNTMSKKIHFSTVYNKQGNTGNKQTIHQQEKANKHCRTFIQWNITT